ncbi:hypothetical protein [Kamptonema formosum]|uniref:hypothetical protein n=1 Tax=Kamptonema formosum TaxID=331992 RepID=UPI00034C54F2|nr:hypothetical protein [Oscillatoria sp. PCC 10802]
MRRLCDSPQDFTYIVQARAAGFLGREKAQAFWPALRAAGSKGVPEALGARRHGCGRDFGRRRDCCQLPVGKG